MLVIVSIYSLRVCFCLVSREIIISLQQYCHGGSYWKRKGIGAHFSDMSLHSGFSIGAAQISWETGGGTRMAGRVQIWQQKNGSITTELTETSLFVSKNVGRLLYILQSRKQLLLVGNHSYLELFRRQFSDYRFIFTTTIECFNLYEFVCFWITWYYSIISTLAIAVLHLEIWWTKAFIAKNENCKYMQTKLLLIWGFSIFS